jgi:hypothetical protein
MPRKYAAETTVSVAKSRGEIDKLLQEWGATGVQWTDEWDTGTITLRFQWPHKANLFRARMSLSTPPEDELRLEACNKNTGVFSFAKMKKLQAARGKQEHRLLFILIKATLNAVDAGVITDVEAFLPYLEGNDGRTVGEVGSERLPMLMKNNAGALLGA